MPPLPPPEPAAAASRRAYAAAREELALLRKERNALAFRCERHEAALGAASDGVWDVHLQTGRAHYSVGWARMLGREPAEIGDNVDGVWSLMHPDDRPGVESLVADHIGNTATEPYRTRFRLKHRDGHWVEVLSRGEVIRDHEGQAVRFIGTHVDLSDLGEAEQDAPVGGLPTPGDSRLKPDAVIEGAGAGDGVARAA